MESHLLISGNNQRADEFFHWINEGRMEIVNINEQSCAYRRRVWNRAMSSLGQAHAAYFKNSKDFVEQMLHSTPQPLPKSLPIVSFLVSKTSRTGWSTCEQMVVSLLVKVLILDTMGLAGTFGLAVAKFFLYAIIMAGVVNFILSPLLSSKNQFFYAPSRMVLNNETNVNFNESIPSHII